MGIYSRYVLPKLIDAACSQPPMQELRSRYVSRAHGDVLEIDIVPTRNPDHTVDLLIRLIEGRRIRYGVGLGYGTDTGPVVTGSWVNRWVNRP